MSAGAVSRGGTDAAGTHVAGAAPAGTGPVGSGTAGASVGAGPAEASGADMRARLALVGGLLLGVSGDLLLRARGPLGLNLFLLVVAVATVSLALHRRAGAPPGRHAMAWFGVAVLFSAGVVWRDAAVLKLLAVAVALAALALPALRAGAARAGRAISDYAAAWGAAGVNAATGAGLALRDLDWSRLRAATRAGGRQQRALAVLRGVALALPLLIVFGALFAEADPVFASVISGTLRIDLDTLLSHVVPIALLSWVAAGYLYGSLSRRGLPAVESFARLRPPLGITEIGVVTGLLNVLFLLFVLLQVRYLFGGSLMVEVTPGLTYAEYARRGFFELAFAVALVVPLLLAGDALLRRERPADDRLFRVLAGVLILLVAAVMASAFERMRAYQAAYGLTEARVYVTAVLVLIGVLLLWFAATVLRGRRQYFASGAVAAAIATVAVLHVVNPDALIARTNSARATAQVDGFAAHPVPFDTQYATTLGADAVPVLIGALHALPAEARGPIACRLLRRWPPGERTPLRSWNWSDRRARRAVGEHEPWLAELAGAGCRG
jgi:hypothetical protein